MKLNPERSHILPYSHYHFNSFLNLIFFLLSIINHIGLICSFLWLIYFLFHFIYYKVIELLINRYEMFVFFLAVSILFLFYSYIKLVQYFWIFISILVITIILVSLLTKKLLIRIILPYFSGFVLFGTFEWWLTKNHPVEVNRWGEFPALQKTL